MSKNWMRHFELQVLNNKGEGISLSNFKVTFNIEKMPSSQFGGFVGNFRIYNLSRDTQNRIMGNEFSKIRVIAGYDGIAADVKASEVGIARDANADNVGQMDGRNYGLIFNGDIRFTIKGKDNATDSWILLQCIDCWEGHLHGRVKTTVAAGWTYDDLFNLGMKSLEPFGITRGNVPDVLHNTVFPRGCTIYSTTSKLMTEIAENCNAYFWYDNNQVNIIPKDKYIGEKAVVLNADTGLIGMPQQTMGGGVNVRCLINPNIKLGGLIRIDQASVYRAALGNGDVAMANGRISERNQDGVLVVDTPQRPKMIDTDIAYAGPGIDADGDYFVGMINYTGDTRGQAWYMDLLCLAKGNMTPMSRTDLDKTHAEQ
ncbi:baseplate hub protein [Pectobacterium actinidiae]|uniref:baseplate hub protein n=1 Tax=Pectobacterium actinidiae TaxID=1507808 RepID=UPI004040B036